MAEYIERAKVSRHGEVWAWPAVVIENGRHVSVTVKPEGEAPDVIAIMEFSEKKAIGELIRYFGLVRGESVPETWTVTPPLNCRNCS